MEVKVLSQDGVLQRMWSRSLIFLFVEVFKVFSQVRVPHCADFFKMRMGDFKGGFRTFPQPPKVRRLPASRVRECPPVPAHPSWALIKWLRPGSLMSLAALWMMLLPIYRGGGGGSEGVTGGLRRRWRCCPDWRRGSGECMQLGAPHLHCSGVGTDDGLGRQAAVVCFSWG